MALHSHLLLLGLLMLLGLLDGTLMDYFHVSVFVSSALHGALLALFCMENWVLLHDLLQAQHPVETEEKVLLLKDLVSTLHLQNLLLEKELSELKLKLKNKKSIQSWHHCWHSLNDLAPTQ